MPSDQLSLGSKLSPRFGGSSSVTTPTSAEMQSGAGSKSGSNTNSWAGSQHGMLEASSPISGKGSPSFFGKGSPGFFKSTPTVPEHPIESTSPQIPAYEAAYSPPITGQSQISARSPPLPLAQQTMQTQTQQGAAGQTASTQRLSKMKLPSIRLAAAPKRNFKKWERSPETPGRVEQWPGSM
jgi:hypothetical protein